MPVVTFPDWLCTLTIGSLEQPVSFEMTGMKDHMIAHDPASVAVAMRKKMTGPLPVGMGKNEHVMGRVTGVHCPSGPEKLFQGSRRIEGVAIVNIMTSRDAKRCRVELVEMTVLSYDGELSFAGQQAKRLEQIDRKLSEHIAAVRALIEINGGESGRTTLPSDDSE